MDFPLKAGNLSQFQSPPTTRQAARRRPSSLGVNPAFEARPPVFCATPTSHLHRSRGVCGWSFRLGYPCPGQSPTWHAQAARGVCPRTAVAPPAKLAHRRLKAGRSALQADGGEEPRPNRHGAGATGEGSTGKSLKPRAVPTAAALPASSEGNAHDPRGQRPRPPGRWGRQRRGVGGPVSAVRLPEGAAHWSDPRDSSSWRSEACQARLRLAMTGERPAAWLSIALQ